MDIRSLRSNDDHRAAFQDIDRVWGVPAGSDDGDKLDTLVALVERYGEANFALPGSSPLDVLKFVMRENDYTQSHLTALLD
jgi:antitoxin component HigA of HigAB toxin-antitoxin module